MRRLLIGLGNVDRGDDAVGIRVAARIGALAPDQVEVVTTYDPASLLDIWDGGDRVVVVDGMVSGREPGTVECFDAGTTALPGSGWESGGTHALGLGAAVELSRALGRLPAHLAVVAVEIGATVPGAALSDEVSAAADSAARTALAHLSRDDL